MGLRDGYKIVTHDWRSPLQEGAPLCDGVLPVTLPAVELDTSPRECAAGYHYTATLAHAMAIAGLWKDGRSARCLVVTAAEDAIERGAKRRSSQLTLERLCTPAETRQGLHDLVSGWAGSLTHALVDEQEAWYEALRRPRQSEDLVVEGLLDALTCRQLPWGLVQIRAAREAWEARDAWEAWEAREAREVWAAWATRDVTWWAARNARNALTYFTAVRLGWLTGRHTDPTRLTVGLRDAYAEGLGGCLPLPQGQLGWWMASA